MRQKILILVILCLFFAGCGNSEESPETTVATPPTNTPANPIPSEVAVENTAVSSPTTPAAATAVPLPLLPEDPAVEVDASDWLTFMTAQGYWQEGEGLVEMLSYLVGEREYTAVFGGNQIDLHTLRGLTGQAAAYIDSHPEEPYTADLTRLLTIISPTTEALEQFAVAADDYQSRTHSPLAKPNREETETCSDIWHMGFPPPTTEPAPICVLHHTIPTSDGDRYRLYYPVQWRDNTALQSRLADVIQAVTESERVYSELENIRSVNIIFGTLSAAEAPEVGNTSLMMVPTRSAAATQNDPCPVVIYRNAWDGESDLDGEQFKQSLAHELFHCMQEQVIGATTNYPAAKWWQEGSAEYFSNVVFPDVDYEHRWAISVDIAVANETPLTRMSYLSYIFFQFLENQMGSPDAVFLLLRTLPVGGTEADQMAALAAWPNMDSLFNQFVRAYVEENIFDTNRIQLDLNPQPLDTLSGDEARIFEVTPFQISLFYIGYEKGFTYDVEIDQDGLPYQHAVKRTGLEGWSSFPEEIDVSCEGEDLQLIVTTTQPQPMQQARLNYSASETETDFTCDPCLVGTWRMDVAASMNEQSIFYQMTSIAGTVTFEEAFGDVVVEFTEDGRFTYTSTDFGYRLSADTGEEEMGPMVIESRSSGIMTGTYRIRAENQVIYSEMDSSGMSGTRTISFPQVGISNSGPLTFAEGGLTAAEAEENYWQYSCSEDQLQMDQVINDGEALWQHYFQRVSP